MQFALMASSETLGITIVKASQPARIELSISNLSTKPLRMWEEWNSWGAAHWRVLVVRAGRVEVFYQNPDRGFTLNQPTFIEIKPKTHIKHILDLGDGDWRGPDPKAARFRPGDTIIVIYDVPKSYEIGDEMSRYASKAGVWFGVATASTMIP